MRHAACMPSNCTANVLWLIPKSVAQMSAMPLGAVTNLLSIVFANMDPNAIVARFLLRNM